ncbi:ammonia-forming cytochrome c nitrite reductase subunit c552 [Vulgatibacter incomptus]|uniref:nitrite reductase (cytochrome; ammonia-forming) n=1 Tax=Vulgatibacter incomptus TaxID=1391653 RepID=A0A0K1PEY0_9BACT|nr:ammonia-forming cytochrome c nitrite reductase subunit c552 [Vulgatibacter incomptus]AKU92075.1 Cytochrome c552 precursor [Vulgatibacter incomptus]
MTNDTTKPRKKPGRATLIGTVAVAAVAAAGTSALLVNIFERKAESRNPFFRVVELDEKTEDPAVWGKNFPIQYDAYLRTTDMVRTRYGGSEAMPRTPTEADPRSIVARSKVETDPRLKTMWAGYPFSVDYRQKRGHAYMLEDQEQTRRVKEFNQPGTCLHCHASIVNPYTEAGDGDFLAGFDKLNRMSFQEARTHVQHPISCIDCHDPKTMQLRVTRPGFLEGIKALKASEGIADYDPNTMATRQEMRSYVCGQCHVEYYFKGPEKRVTYPWAKGLKIENILDYYEEVGFTDFVHAETGAKVLKAQHPEFEMWSQGIHARSGVSCTDCHMPYERVGAMKVTDHHVRSPMLNVNRACQTCHKWSEDELKARVETIQERTVELRNIALDALVDLVGDLKAARQAGRSDAELETPRSLQKRAQMMIDFIESENSAGFHAPQEAARILAQAIDTVRKAQNALKSTEPAVGTVQ